MIFAWYVFTIYIVYFMCKVGYIDNIFHLISHFHPKTWIFVARILTKFKKILKIFGPFGACGFRLFQLRCSMHAVEYTLNRPQSNCPVWPPHCELPPSPGPERPHFGFKSLFCCLFLEIALHWTMYTFCTVHLPSYIVHTLDNVTLAKITGDT